MTVNITVKESDLHFFYWARPPVTMDPMKKRLSFLTFYLNNLTRENIWKLTEWTLQFFFFVSDTLLKEENDDFQMKTWNVQ